MAPPPLARRLSSTNAPRAPRAASVSTSRPSPYVLSSDSSPQTSRPASSKTSSPSTRASSRCPGTSTKNILSIPTYRVRSLFCRAYVDRSGLPLFFFLYKASGMVPLVLWPFALALCHAATVRLCRAASGHCFVHTVIYLSISASLYISLSTLEAVYGSN